MCMRVCVCPQHPGQELASSSCAVDICLRKEQMLNPSACLSPTRLGHPQCLDLVCFLAGLVLVGTAGLCKCGVNE